MWLQATAKAFGTGQIKSGKANHGFGVRLARILKSGYVATFGRDCGLKRPDQEIKPQSVSVSCRVVEAFGMPAPSVNPKAT